MSLFATALAMSLCGRKRNKPLLLPRGHFSLSKQVPFALKVVKGDFGEFGFILGVDVGAGVAEGNAEAGQRLVEVLVGLVDFLTLLLELLPFLGEDVGGGAVGQDAFEALGGLGLLH